MPKELSLVIFHRVYFVTFIKRLVSKRGLHQKATLPKSPQELIH